MLVVAVTAAGSLLAAVALALTQGAAAAGPLVYMLMVPIPFLSAGIYLLWRQPENRAGWLLVCGTAFTMAYAVLLEQVIRIRLGDGVEGWMAWALTGEALVTMAGLACLVLLIGLFPSGRARTRGERRLAKAIWWLPLPMLVAVLANEKVLLDGITYGSLELANPIHIEALAWMGPATAGFRYFLGAALFVGIGLLVFRYRREASPERRQIRWVLFGSTAAMVIGIFPFIALPLLGAASDLHAQISLTIGALALLLIPITVVAAIEQPAWLDTDAVIRKSFIYGALSIGIFVVYAAVAAGLGLAAGARLPIEVAILVTAVLAFAFQPARRRLQAVADRWVFGERPSALEAMAGFDVSEDAGELAPRLAELVRTAVRLRWVEVDLPPGPTDLSGGPGGDASHIVPIVQAGEKLGEIRCGPKLAGQWTSQDRDLVAALASQAGLLATNARLTSRIVQAQEAERRRIERNIHDGAQQELVALVAKLGLAWAQVRRGELDEDTLVELQSDAGAILRDLRDFAQGIHPSVLTDGGLVEAVEDRCSRLPLEVATEFSPGLRHRRFGDDVEGAAYFFVAEGLANILKHAGASRARVGIHQTNGTLELIVGDNGSGFDPTSTRHDGLAGLSDRFAALSGSVSVEASPGEGTVLRARLPVEEAGL